jgi:hypothetical protein
MGASSFAGSGIKSAAKNTEVPKQYMTEALGAAAKAPKLTRADFVVGSRDKQAAEIADFIDFTSPGITLDDLTYDSELKDRITHLIRNNRKGVTTDDVLNKLMLNKQYPKTNRALVDPMYVSPTPSIGNKAVVYSNPEFYKSSGTMGGRVPTGDYGLPDAMIRTLQQKLDNHAKRPLVFPMSKEEIKRTKNAIETLYKQSIQYSPKDYQPFRSSDAVKMGLSVNKDGGYINKYAEGGKLPEGILRSRLESHMSPAEAQDYIDNYEQGGVVDVYQLMGMPTPDMYEMGGDVMMEEYGRGGMIKRKDGSYSRRGLWDNIRANRGSGRKPTKEMLKQERKIRAAEKKEYGGMIDMYGMGGIASIVPDSRVISSQNFPNMGMAMGGAVNYPEGLQMPIFAMGGMTGPLTKINVEKGELLTDKDGRIVTEYRGGGMVPHPEEGIDERGTVSAQEGQFVIPTKYAESYKAAMKNNDGLLAKAIRRRVVVEKAKNEAKDAQIAMAEEQKAAKAMNRMAAKYGGAIQRMYAKGGMVPMYQGGGGTPRYSDYFNFNDYSGYGPILGQTYGPSESTPMTNPIPGIGSYLQGFQESMPMAPMRTLNSIGAAVNPLSIAEPQYQLMGAPEVSDAYKNVNKPLRGEGTYPAFYSRLTGAGLDKTADTSATANKSTGASMGNSQVDKYLMAAQFLPAAYNLGRGIFEKAWEPGSYETPADLKWEDVAGEAGRRGMLGAYMANKYNARQIGGSNALAALQAGSTAYQRNVADYEEALENRNRMGRAEVARLNKAIQQSNMQMRMNRDYLAQQARERKAEMIGAGIGNIGQASGQLWQNKQMMDALRMAYPPTTNINVPSINNSSYTSADNRTTAGIRGFKPDTSIPELNRIRAARKFRG